MKQTQISGARVDGDQNETKVPGADITQAIWNRVKNIDRHWIQNDVTRVKMGLHEDKTL